jgi:hypothetical protein
MKRRDAPSLEVDVAAANMRIFPIWTGGKHPEPALGRGIERICRVVGPFRYQCMGRGKYVDLTNSDRSII